MSELGAERRAALEQALLSSTRDTCDEVECDPSGNAVIHLEVIAPLIAGWLAAEREAVIDAVRDLHNGGGGPLADGEWCMADGEVLPCPTLRALAVARCERHGALCVYCTTRAEA